MIADIQSTAEMAKVAELLKYATIVVSSLPLLIMYPFFQKYFDKGIMVGSVKVRWLGGAAMKKESNRLLRQAFLLCLYFNDGMWKQRKDGGRDQSGYTSRRRGVPLKEKQNYHLSPVLLQHLHRSRTSEQSSNGWKNRRMYILTGPALWQISLRIRKIWHWHSLEICRMGSLMRE